MILKRMMIIQGQKGKSKKVLLVQEYGPPNQGLP